MRSTLSLISFTAALCTEESLCIFNFRVCFLSHIYGVWTCDHSSKCSKRFSSSSRCRESCFKDTPADILSFFLKRQIVKLIPGCHWPRSVSKNYDVARHQHAQCSQVLVNHANSWYHKHAAVQQMGFNLRLKTVPIPHFLLWEERLLKTATPSCERELFSFLSKWKYIL